MSGPKYLRPDTLSLHAGQRPDSDFAARAVPIYQTTSFLFRDTDHAAALFNLERAGHLYSRISNPTVAVLEERIAALEGGVGAVCTASGQAALHLAIVTLMDAGSHIVSSASIYGGSHNLFTHTLPRFGIETTFVDARDASAFKKAIKRNTRLVFGETLGNPGLEIMDLPAVAGIAHDAGIPLMIDNTFATPHLCRPFEHGVDIVMHSATKFLGGHGVAIGGALALLAVLAVAQSWGIQWELFYHQVVQRPGEIGRVRLHERFNLELLPTILALGLGFIQDPNGTRFGLTTILLVQVAGLPLLLLSFSRPDRLPRWQPLVRALPAVRPQLALAVALRSIRASRPNFAIRAAGIAALAICVLPAAVAAYGRHQSRATDEEFMRRVVAVTEPGDRVFDCWTGLYLTRLPAFAHFFLLSDVFRILDTDQLEADLLDALANPAVTAVIVDGNFKRLPQPVRHYVQREFERWQGNTHLRVRRRVE